MQKFFVTPRSGARYVLLFLLSITTSVGIQSAFFHDLYVQAETIHIPAAPTLMSLTYDETLRATMPQEIDIPPDPDTTFPKSNIPTKLIIPSVDIDSPVQVVGQKQNGEMDVPSGKGTDVGWFKDGTIPGNMGSAVLDAHVFAAFSSLKDLRVGSDVYVMNAEHQKLHFVVSQVKTYALGALSPQTLFYQNDARRLNLITCAGALTADHSTYDHRLVVFTTFVGVVNA